MVRARPFGRGLSGKSGKADRGDRMFLQTVVTGLSIGGIYALMAVGYSLVFSVLSFSNFAHGAVIMLGAYIGLGLVTKLHFGLGLVVAVYLAWGIGRLDRVDQGPGRHGEHGKQQRAVEVQRLEHAADERLREVHGTL